MQPRMRGTTYSRERLASGGNLTPLRSELIPPFVGGTTPSKTQTHSKAQQGSHARRCAERIRRVYGPSARAWDPTSRPMREASHSRERRFRHGNGWLATLPAMTS